MTLTDYRVLYQYRNAPDDRPEPKTPDGEPEVVRQSFGPTFAFTTMLAASPEAAAAEVAAIHAGYDYDFQIVQVVEANDFETGFHE